MASTLAMILYAIAQADEEVNVLERIDALLAPVREALKGSQCRSLPPSKRHDAYIAALVSLNPTPPAKQEDDDGR